MSERGGEGPQLRAEGCKSRLIALIAPVVTFCWVLNLCFIFKKGTTLEKRKSRNKKEKSKNLKEARFYRLLGFLIRFVQEITLM